ncbi:hypothetical protein M3Y94_00363800 [Aphelenchoides besseyi]|nr:hypothetical protein M3Y94_00363800 [Aphelenchoides besseyi]
MKTDRTLLFLYLHTSPQLQNSSSYTIRIVSVISEESINDYFNMERREACRHLVVEKVRDLTDEQKILPIVLGLHDYTLQICRRLSANNKTKENLLRDGTLQDFR